MIIGLSGKKQAGKNTVANVLHGIVLKDRGMIKDYKIAEDGKLWIRTTDASGSEGWGEFDVARRDSAFLQWAEPNMYPYVKMYSFADALKWLAVDLFDVPEECCFGTDDQKNQIQEHLLWQNMPGRARYWRSGPMTAREFLQYFGTDVMRYMWEPVWVNKCIKDIQREGTLLALITDVRFPNEVAAVEKAGGTVLRIMRQMFEDDHKSETALDKHTFTEYLDNRDDSLESTVAKVQAFYTSLINKGK